LLNQNQKSLWDVVNESKKEMNKSAENIADTIVTSTDFNNQKSITTFLDIISSLLATNRFDVVDEALMKLQSTKTNQAVDEELEILIGPVKHRLKKSNRAICK